MTDNVTNTDKLKIGVLGAGISGMSAAWELAQEPDVQVDVFERDPTAGGLAGWFEVGGTTLEKFYHHIYRNDYDLIKLIEEMDLGNDLVFEATNTGCFYVNSIYRLSSPIDLLKYKPLKFIDRIRLGLLAVKTRTLKDWKELDDKTAKQWLLELAGQNVYDIVWAPLFRSKFGKFADQVSAAWLWSKFVQRGGSRSKTGREELGYLKGGYGKLFDKLQEKLAERGVSVHLSTPVETVVVENGKAKGLKINGEIRPYDAVLVTAQLPDFLAHSAGLPDQYRRNLDKIGYLANACLVLRLKKPLSDTYWVNITDANCPFVGIIEQTNLLGAEHYQGNHLAYISRYMEEDDQYYSMGPDELFNAYFPYMKKVFPAFETDWVLDKYLWREPHAQPVVSVGYRNLIPDHRTPVKDLYLSTMAQIFPEDRQMSNGSKLARQTARMIIEDKSR